MAILETSIGAMMAWAVVGAASLLLAAVPSNLVEGFPQEQRLICICIAGGIAGGLLSVLLFPKTTLRSTAAKWLVSPITAGIFGPAICQYHKIDDNIWYALATNGIIGLCAWSALFVLLPLVPDIAMFLAKKWFPGLIKEEQPKQPPYPYPPYERDDTPEKHGRDIPPMTDRSPRKRR